VAFDSHIVIIFSIFFLFVITQLISYILFVLDMDGCLLRTCVILELLRHKFFAHLLAPILQLFLLFIVLFLSEVGFDLLVPGHEASLVKHLGEEEVDRRCFYLVHEHLLSLLLRQLLIIRFFIIRDLRDLILSD